MTAQFDAFITILMVISLVVFMRGPWRGLCTAFARQEMFQCRDAIFDMAVAGKIGFADRAYIEARLGIERNIRFAHEVSLSRFLLIAACMDLSGKRPSVDDALAEIESDELRQEIEEQIHRSRKIMILMIAAKSPLLMLFGSLILCLSKTNSSVRQFCESYMVKGKLLIQLEADKAISV